MFNHFCTSGHYVFLENVSVTFIDKTDPSDPLKRENYWRSTLKTIAPFGLNIEKSVCKFYINILSICIFIGLVRFEDKDLGYIGNQWSFFIFKDIFYLFLFWLLFVVIFVIIVVIIIIIIVFMVVITIFIFSYFCFYYCCLYSSSCYCLYCHLSLHYCYCYYYLYYFHLSLHYLHSYSFVLITIFVTIIIKVIVFVIIIMVTTIIIIIIVISIYVIFIVIITLLFLLFLLLFPSRLLFLSLLLLLLLLLVLPCKFLKFYFGVFDIFWSVIAFIGRHYTFIWFIHSIYLVILHHSSMLIIHIPLQQFEYFLYGLLIAL